MKKRIIIAFAVSSVVLLGAYWINSKGPETRGSPNNRVSSPDGIMEIRTYTLEAGAVGPSVEHAHVFDVRRGTEGDYIWFGPLLEEAPRWLDTYIVEVGNQVLDIRSDTYDVRTAKPVREADNSTLVQSGSGGT